MKKLSVPCDFEGRPASFQVWIERPAPGFHPLHFQATWLREERGGEISEEVVERVQRAFSNRQLKAEPHRPEHG